MFQRRFVAAGCALVVGLAASAVPTSAQAKDGRLQYAAKYLCGEATAALGASLHGGARPGRYATSISIHNPYDEPVDFQSRRSITFPVAEGNVISGSPLPGAVSFALDGSLGPHESVMLDCEDLDDYELPPAPPVITVGPTPRAGFIVVESARSLDVSVGYTSGQNDAEATSIDVHQVKEREL